MQLLGRFAKISAFARGSIIGVEGQRVCRRAAQAPPTLDSSAPCYCQCVLPLAFTGCSCRQLRIFNVQSQLPPYLHTPSATFQFRVDTELLILQELKLPPSYATLHVSLCSIIVTLLLTLVAIVEPLIVALYATSWLPQSQSWVCLMLQSHCTGCSVRHQVMGVR